MCWALSAAAKACTSAEPGQKRSRVSPWLRRNREGLLRARVVVRVPKRAEQRPQQPVLHPRRAPIADMPAGCCPRSRRAGLARPAQPTHHCPALAAPAHAAQKFLYSEPIGGANTWQRERRTRCVNRAALPRSPDPWQKPYAAAFDGRIQENRAGVVRRSTRRRQGRTLNGGRYEITQRAAGQWATAAPATRPEP